MFTYTTEPHPTRKACVLAIAPRPESWRCLTQTELAFVNIGGTQWRGHQEPESVAYTLTTAQARNLDALLQAGFRPVTHPWRGVVDPEDRAFYHPEHPAECGPDSFRDFTPAEALALIGAPVRCKRTAEFPFEAPTVGITEAAPIEEIQPQAPTSAITMRQHFAALYSRARKEKLAGADLYAAALELTGEPSDTFQGPLAQLLYNAVEKARADVTPMRLHLQRQVLNCWGHGNPYRSPPMESPRFPSWQRQVRRADALRNRLKEAGRLQCDAGGWVQCLIPVKRDKSPASFATMGDYATACAGTSRWFVGRWSSRTRAKYEHRFTPAEYAALTLVWERAHNAPEAAQEAQSEPEAISAAHEPENAPTGRDLGDADPIANILARLDAIEATISDMETVEALPAVSEGHRLQHTSAEETAALLYAKHGIDVRPPSGEIQPKRNPAHERAIRRAWAERKRTRELEAAMVNACNNQRDSNGEIMRLRSDLERLRPQYDNAAKARTRFMEEMIAASERERVTLAKRRRAVLKARDLQSRLYAEHKLVDQANERRRKARDDWRNAEARLATVTRERDSAHVALQAVTARAERAEGALGAVGERLAAVEGVIQQRTA
jgi:hypothetical protein